MANRVMNVPPSAIITITIITMNTTTNITGMTRRLARLVLWCLANWMRRK